MISQYFLPNSAHNSKHQKTKTRRQTHGTVDQPGNAYIQFAVRPQPRLEAGFLTLLTPLFLGATLVEYLYLKRVGKSFFFKKNEVITNMLLGGSYQAMELVWFALFVSAFMEWIYTFRIATIEVTPIASLPWSSASSFVITGFTVAATACAGSGVPMWFTTVART